MNWPVAATGGPVLGGSGDVDSQAPYDGMGAQDDLVVALSPFVDLLDRLGVADLVERALDEAARGRDD